MRIASSLTLLFVLIGIVASLLLKQFMIPLALSGPDLVSAYIQVWACVAVLISAAFVVTSYIQTNKAFQLGQKPQLLVQVVNEQNNAVPGIQNHVTKIHYENRSPNQFEDLSFEVTLHTSNIKLNLSDLFTERMYMAGFDSRDRRFLTEAELQKRGFSLSSFNPNTGKAFLDISYRFTYTGKKQRVDVQQYYWGSNGWTIC